jgi:hypothetical protein
MGDSGDYLEQTGGAFDLDSLKKKYRRREAAARPRNALAAIEREILEEIASQSGRYGDRLDALLGEMQTLRHAIDQAIVDLSRHAEPAVSLIEEVNARIADYNRLRRQAQQVQHYLIIHREAMGFWHHDDVFRLYPIPASLRPWPTT